MTEKQYKLKTLLSLAKKKFGLTVSEDSFYSEALKSLGALKNIKPLLTAKGNTERAEIIKKIEEYFTNKSADYLKKVIG